MAVSAKTQADIASQIQIFFVAQKRYPQGLDSLLTTGATKAIYAPDTTDANTQIRGLPYAGADGKRLHEELTATTFTKLGNNDVPSAKSALYVAKARWRLYPLYRVTSFRNSRRMGPAGSFSVPKSSQRA